MAFFLKPSVVELEPLALPLTDLESERGLLPTAEQENAAEEEGEYDEEEEGE